ncbi:MAG: hypothetical protein AVDCRST_MAG05-3851, partial [uncultured Rubrobacteraceae bacterium]
GGKGAPGGRPAQGRQGRTAGERGGHRPLLVRAGGLGPSDLALGPRPVRGPLLVSGARRDQPQGPPRHAEGPPRREDSRGVRRARRPRAAGPRLGRGHANLRGPLRQGATL